MRLARESELDLVEVAPMARPPVAKLMDYGKFKYENAQKARESRRNQTNTVIKEMKLRPKIDSHDYETKKGHVVRFLKAGDKVKITIMFRGREQSRPELGYNLLKKLADGRGRVRLRRVLAEAGRPQHVDGARPAQEEDRGPGRGHGPSGTAGRRRGRPTPRPSSTELAERRAAGRGGATRSKRRRGPADNLDPDIDLN